LEKVIYLPEIENYINNLIDVLFEKEYFGFLEDSKLYVSKLIDYIDQNIHLIQPNISPKQLIHKGKYYISYSSNKRTTWYIFFEKRNRQILITYIFNNHCPETKYL